MCQETFLSCFFKRCIDEDTKKQIEDIKKGKESLKKDFNLKILLRSIKKLKKSVQNIKEHMNFKEKNENSDTAKLQFQK